MPRGRPRKDPNAAPTTPKKRGRKPGQKRTRKDGQPVGAASFVIDEAGRMEIRDGQQSIRLERDDVKRLGAFIDRTKSVRA